MSVWWVQVLRITTLRKDELLVGGVTPPFWFISTKQTGYRPWVLDLQQPLLERFKLWPASTSYSLVLKMVHYDTILKRAQQCKVILLMSQKRKSQCKTSLFENLNLSHASETHQMEKLHLHLNVDGVNLTKYASHKPEGKWSVEWGTPNCSNHRLSSPEYMSYRCQNQDFRYYLCSVLIFILLDIFLVFHLSALSVRSSLWLRNKALLDRE